MHRREDNLCSGWRVVGAALGAGLGVSAAAIAAVAVAVAVTEIALLDALETGELLAFPERDQGHALGGAAHLADLRHRRADQHAARGDEHHLVVVVDQHRANDRAVALGGLDGDDALPATTVARILAERRALAVAVLGGGENSLRLVVGGEHAPHALGFAQAHAAHARGLPAHRPHVALLETHRF